ncbi:CPBP family intramembrane glutamic endopeptidase [Rhodococcus gannanensis]|uniref:CPBP family intramembrane glutamic endopeptidase n=1 Tax=Rhodococcus gannanensis TaxID=1960308 RepID=A0ABW4P3H3_9NOCA
MVAVESDSRGRLAGIVARHPLVSFFVIAYGLSWLVWSQFVLSQDGSGWFGFHATWPFMATIGIGTFGPAVAAVIVIGVTEGEGALIAFLKRIVMWRVGFRWWAFALLGFPVTATIGCLLMPGVASSITTEGLDRSLTDYLPFLLYPTLLVGGPLGEELGWRGFALPRLQQRFVPLVATVVMGLLWTCWHAPIWFSNNWSVLNVQNVLCYSLFLVLASFQYTWASNHTGGSILIAVVLHASMDAFPNVVLFPMFPALGETTSFGVQKLYLALIIGFGLFAVAVTVATKGRLGLPTGVQPPGAPEVTGTSVHSDGRSSATADGPSATFEGGGVADPVA